MRIIRRRNLAKLAGKIPADAMPGESWLKPDPVLRSSLPARPADRSYFPALSSSAKKLIAAIRLQPRNANTARHLDLLKYLSASWIDSPDIALVAFPRSVPKLAVDPGDPGYETVRFDRAENRPVSGSI